MIYLDDGNEEDEDEGGGKKQGEDSQAILAKMLKTRTIIIAGEINKNLVEKTVKELLLLENAGDEPVKVFIDSPGGDADAGFAIFDMLRFIKPSVKTVGMGLAASAAALILLAAKKEDRFGLPNSHYLIHQPLSQGYHGVATDVEIHAREIEKMRKRINHIIAQETGKPVDEVEKDTDRDYWMSAEEALGYGLISKVIARRSEL